MKRKTVILGAGHVGSHVASMLAVRNVCEEIVLVDLIPEKAAAQALDVADSVSSLPGSAIVRAGEHAECAEADLIICAIGEPRKPGQTRLDLLDRSVVLCGALIEQLKSITITCPVMTITNPADIVAHLMRKGLGLPREKCFGTGTLLDTARLRRITAEKLGIDRRSVQVFALGEHGDSSVAALSCGTAMGQPLEAFSIPAEEIENAMRMAGMDIINGKGSTEFGIGAAAADMALAILRDEKRVMPASVQLMDEYGARDIHCGVPCIIGANGIEKIIELPLNEREQNALKHSLQVINTHTQKALCAYGS